MSNYSIGDCIAYDAEVQEEVYGRFMRITRYGCIIEKAGNNNIKVVQQYGGEILEGVEPEFKVSRERFLENFIVYKEYEKPLLQKIDILPEFLRKVILNFFIV